MSLLYFIYLVLYVIAMVLIFALSFMMLHPTARGMFKAPVPHIHDQIGKELIPWGFTYVVFLPDFYLKMNGVPWRDHAYIVVSMLTTVIILSVSVWAFLAMLQQKVNHRLLQPLVLSVPSAIMAWYTVSPAQWLLQCFTYVLVAEIVVMMCYYVRLYRVFVVDLKTNYSSISSDMIRAMRIQWAASILLLVVFGACMVYDHEVWNIIDIVANFICICTFIYTSEHLMPLPVEDDEDTPLAPIADVTVNAPCEKHSEIDLTGALHDNCEATLLFCNPDLSLQDLAVALGTNRTYLSKWFADHDTTFYNYINGLRIRYAASQLSSTQNSVAQIQAAAGFTSKTTFRKYFIDHFGCSPTEYRKNEI